MMALRYRSAAVLLVVGLLMGSCASRPGLGRPTLDAIAREYVQLQLGIAVHDPDHIAWYFGPARWREEAGSRRLAIPALKETADRLLQELDAMSPAPSDPMVARRRQFLAAHLHGALFRLTMLEGVRVPFDEEARRLFGITPRLQQLESFDSTLERIDRLIPGEGPLAERVEAFRTRYAIPPDRLAAVMEVAIEECRRRTAAQLSFPKGERFSLELVRGQLWSGNNVYLGDGQGNIQINTDFPVGIERAVELACHEGYPGHHTHVALLDTRLVKGRGWVEYSVIPLYGPIAFLVEGEASYAPALAFPGRDLVRFEREQLYGLAGLDAGAAEHVAAVREAMNALAGARLTIGRMFLDGQIDRDRALDLLQRYQLVSRAYAGQILSFISKYRSYIINYGLGEPAVRSYFQRIGADREAQWRAMEHLLSEPTLPSDFGAAE